MTRWNQAYTARSTDKSRRTKALHPSAPNRYGIHVLRSARSTRRPRRSWGACRLCTRADLVRWRVDTRVRRVVLVVMLSRVASLREARALLHVCVKHVHCLHKTFLLSPSIGHCRSVTIHSGYSKQSLELDGAFVGSGDGQEFSLEKDAVDKLLARAASCGRL